MKKTITRSDLVESIHLKIGLSRSDSAVLLQMVLDHIVDATVKGESVKLASFATFHVRDKRLRIGRNPKTGVEVPITPRRVLTFKPSNILKKYIADEYARNVAIL